MAFEYYVRSGQKRLRRGYTTGTCAALAASGAARLLLSGIRPEILRLVTPKGITVEVTPQFCAAEDNAAVCAVVKDAGDDPDVTDGCVIAARVEKTRRGIFIDGGQGVGRVTKPGLDQPVGTAAINHVPRRMIADAVRDVCAAAGYTGGMSVIISVPDGEKLAEKTFNPRMGIVGGISILGTSGIVEPVSERAQIDTIALQIRQARASGAERLILTPGNYGLDYLKKTGLDTSGVPVVRISNYAGDALDAAVTEGFSALLLVGHVGKLVKLAGGIMNTHSRTADCRGELFCAHAAVCGADRYLCQALLDAVSTDACIELLDKANLRDTVMTRLLSAIQKHLDHRAGNMQAGAVLFSNRYGFLGQTRKAAVFMEMLSGNFPGKASENFPETASGNFTETAESEKSGLDEKG